MKISVSPLLPFFILIALVGCGKNNAEYLERAEKTFEQQNFVSTIDILNRVLPTWNNSDEPEKKARAYELLGLSYHDLRNTDKAMEAYDQAMQLSQNTYHAAYGLGILSLAKNDFGKAEEYFLKALEYKHNDPQSYYAQKRYAEAKQAFERVVTVSPGVTEALEGLQLAKAKLQRAPIKLKTPAAKRKEKAKTTKSKPKKKR